jgi:hypothetical protein
MLFSIFFCVLLDPEIDLILRGESVPGTIAYSNTTILGQSEGICLINGK